MNKAIVPALLSAMTLFGLTACNTQEFGTETVAEEFGKAHSVNFTGQILQDEDADTKIGLTLKVLPDWRGTTEDDVHIYEIATVPNGTYIYEASKIVMTVSEDYLEADFYAEFDNFSGEITPLNAPATKASSASYDYTAIVSTTRVENEKTIFEVPATQYPEEATWIDPKADMLVGKSINTYDASRHENTIDLRFKRPVGLARLAITNLEGETVQSVTITAGSPLTGWAEYSDIDFENHTVDWKSDESNNVLTMVFPEGRKRTSTFYANFIATPGVKAIQKVEVRTNKWVYTKTTSGNLTFKAGNFTQIAMDMTVKEGGNVVRVGLDPQSLSYVDANSEPVSSITYDIYENNGTEAFVAPTLEIGANVVGTVECSSSNEEVAVVDQDGVATLVGGTGEATITAFVAGDESHSEGSASYKITVTNNVPAEPQEIEFASSEVEYDIYGGKGTLTLPAWVEGKEPKTSVTYSSNSQVITVNETSGVVTVKSGAKAGDTAVITATAEETAAYLSATATCTVTIVDTTPETTDVTFKLEAATELVAGGTYVLVSNGKALVRDGSSATAVDFDANTVSVTVPSELADNVAWTLGTNSDSNNRGNVYDFSNGGYYAGAAMNTGGSTYTYEFQLSQSKTISSSISIQNNNVDLSTGYVYYRGNSSSQYIYYNTSSNVWTLDKQSNGTFPSGCQTYLYVVADERTPQTLSFSSSSAVYDLYTSEWTVAIPTLSGNVTPVTWKSSNEAVASVDNNGNVTIAGTASRGNTAVITATATATSEYKSGSASYTITIDNTDPAGPSYTLITSKSELVSGATYLIVAADINGYNSLGDAAAFAGDQAGNYGSVAAVGGVISGDYSDYEFVISESGSNYTLYGPNGYVTGNSGTSYSRYIQVSSSAVTMSLNMASELSDALISDAFYFYYTKTSGGSTSKEVLYLNEDGKFKIGGSGRKYGVHLYKKN